MYTILVVEDDALLRTFVKSCLESAGYHVIIAFDGNDGYNQLLQNEIDLLLSDIMMPLLDGIGLALKARKIRPNLPILLLTGHAAEHHRAHNFRSIVSGILSKPCGAEKLCASIATILQESYLRRPSNDNAKAT